MISSIRLQHFRSYTDAAFELSPAVTIIAGPNASGKTNLLEAVLVAAQGSSFRAKDQELVQHDHDWTRIDVETTDGARTVKLTTNPAQKTFGVDGRIFKRLPQQRRLPVVLFEPNHMLLFSGAPELRRTFLDDLLEQTVPRFGEYSRHYKRVLSQRNALLKKGLAEQLFVWNIRLSELGGKIAKERARLVRACNEEASQRYSDISGKQTNITLTYATQFPLELYETVMLNKLEQNTELDMLRGFTTSGPHRDDLIAHINGKPFHETASRGEQRTLVLVLKLLELTLKDQTVKSIVLLDDVFSELDISRRAALTQFMTNHQTVITTTNADSVAQVPASHVILTG